MKKIIRLLSVLLILCLTIGVLAACKPDECEHEYKNGVCIKCNEKDPNYSPKICAQGHNYVDHVCQDCGFVDYVSQLTLDMNSDTAKFEVAKVKQYIDGDTTHFNVPSSYEIKFADDTFKARYLAVNTPESTAIIQDYGKKASRYVHDKLANAVSIYVESDGAEWDIDATQSRVMAWVWYKPSADAEYINLNLQLLQEGLGAGSNASNNRYGETCAAALAQAVLYKLDVHSGIQDPEVYRGTVQEVTIKELRLNQSKYNGIKIAVRGVVTVLSGTSAYIEEFDETDGIAYGMQIFMGYNPPSRVAEAIQPGNYVLVTGTFQLSDYGFPPQIADLIYYTRRPNDPDNTRLLESADETLVKASYKELTVNEFFGNSEITIVKTPATDDTPAETETRTIATAEAMRDATICIKNIQVKRTYATTTTKEDGTEVPTGAITIYGEVNGVEISVRTAEIFIDGYPLSEEIFKNKTIDVYGIVDYYSQRGQYQLKIFSLDAVTFHD